MEIKYDAPPKPFLGGWRDAVRDLEYHDAMAQTSTQSDASTVHQNSRSVCVQTLGIQEPIATTTLRTAKAIQTDADCPSLEANCSFSSDTSIKIDEATRRFDACVKIQRFYRYAQLSIN